MMMNPFVFRIWITACYPYIVIIILLGFKRNRKTLEPLEAMNKTVEELAFEIDSWSAGKKILTMALCIAFYWLAWQSFIKIWY